MRQSGWVVVVDISREYNGIDFHPSLDRSYLRLLDVANDESRINETRINETVSFVFECSPLFGQWRISSVEQGS